MTLAAIGNPGTLRRAFALAFGSYLLMAAHQTYGGLSRAVLRVDDGGADQTPATYDTTLATMPVSQQSNLSAAGTFESQLGTFDIVIRPSVALAANATALAAFNRAAAQWEAYISDPITVTIDADFSPLDPGVLGSTASVILQASYTTIRNQVVTDAADEPNDAIVASMPTAAQFTGFLPAGFGFNGNLEASKANLKALGFAGLDISFGDSDADIAFSTSFTFDFDSSNGVTAGQFDFEGVAAHEIGHALGFFSSVDDVDFILPGTSTQIQPSTLDLFRFREGGVNDPATAAEFTTKPRSLTPGTVDIFDQISPSNGTVAEILMSTGIDNGDGNQASHWKDSLGLGILDPTAAPGELLMVQPNDLRSLDLIGYEIALIPEVGAWAFGCVVTCLVGVGALVQRRRKP